MPLARPCGCAGSSEPSLVACARGTMASFMHDAEACKNQSIYILVCASVRTCDDPQESFIIQFHEDAASHHSNSYKIDVRIFKAQLISRST